MWNNFKFNKKKNKLIMKKILITTGGSGGHVIPSLSIYDHLKDYFEITLVTDERGLKYINKNNYTFTLIDVPNLFSKLYLLPINLIKFFISILKSYNYLNKNNINFLISTGGYMSLPLCIASRFLNIKIFLFEPNSVLGRTNKFMLGISKKIICYDRNIKLLPKKFLNKVYTINPILRKNIYLYQKNEKKDFNDTKKILIIGGSQGAKFFDESITKVILKISKELNVEVCQQVFNKNKKILIEQQYNKYEIKHRLFDFDENLFEKLNNYDLAITRAGASAISELSQLCIPFIAIPFPFAKDNHQFYNAKFYENLNCCWIISQDNIDEESFSNKLIQLFNEEDDYFKKKENLEKISNQNTWNIVNKKLLDLINEN